MTASSSSAARGRVRRRWLERKGESGGQSRGPLVPGAARTATVPLTIGGGRWLVDSVGDGADGLHQERQVLCGGEVVAGGAGIACPWHPGVTTCHR